MKGWSKYNETYSYVNKKDTKEQTFCIYKLDVRLLYDFQLPMQEEADVTFTGRRFIN